jgi:hypothetical protein
MGKLLEMLLEYTLRMHNTMFFFLPPFPKCGNNMCRASFPPTTLSTNKVSSMAHIDLQFMLVYCKVYPPVKILLVENFLVPAFRYNSKKIIYLSEDTYSPQYT